MIKFIANERPTFKSNQPVFFIEDDANFGTMQVEGVFFGGVTETGLLQIQTADGVLHSVKMEDLVDADGRSINSQTDIEKLADEIRFMKKLTFGEIDVFREVQFVEIMNSIRNHFDRQFNKAQFTGNVVVDAFLFKLQNICATKDFSKLQFSDVEKFFIGEDLPLVSAENGEEVIYRSVEQILKAMETAEFHNLPQEVFAKADILLEFLEHNGFFDANANTVASLPSLTRDVLNVVNTHIVRNNTTQKLKNRYKMIDGLFDALSTHKFRQLFL